MLKVEQANGNVAVAMEVHLRELFFGGSAQVIDSLHCPTFESIMASSWGHTSAELFLASDWTHMGYWCWSLSSFHGISLISACELPMVLAKTFSDLRWTLALFLPDNPPSLYPWDISHLCLGASHGTGQDFPRPALEVFLTILLPSLLIDSRPVS